jgi:flagellar motor switch protein FliM
MSASNPRTFSFDEIASLDDSAVSLRDWIAKSTAYFADAWRELSGRESQLRLGPIKTDTYAASIAAFSDGTTCCEVEIDDSTRSLWFLRIGTLREIVSELIGSPLAATQLAEGAESVETDALTPVESALAQLFIESLASALSQGWIGQEPLQLRTGALQRDSGKVRLLRAKDLVSSTRIEFDGQSGTIAVDWVLPKQATAEFLEAAIDNRQGLQHSNPSEEMVGKLPVEIVSVLGQARVPMAKLAQLRVGELIVLDQRIHLPLTAYINNSPLCECWPGRLGKMQAIEVTRCLSH